MAVSLTYGVRHLARTVEWAETLLTQFAAADDGRGALYYDMPLVMPDVVRPEDLGVTLLMNSRADGRAFQTLCREQSAIDLSQLPGVSLEETNPDQRRQVAGLVAQIAAWRGFGASLATKLLHKKRPALIPIPDNQAVFGAYMNPRWPAEPSRRETIKAVAPICEALDWIAEDLANDANRECWLQLQAVRRNWTRVEIWDAVWWAYFRLKEPVRPPA